ncbi:MAG: ferrous iron transport protein B [Crocinitomicaceae bacterium]|nr:ferrous iron transport protein B [Crocinitomicaceae bacterium]
MDSSLKVALLGNPNIGKTTLFNALCGLNQKTGNYPGVTIDKKVGHFSIDQKQVEIIDLPGINSLYPKSKDEELVVDYLVNGADGIFPDKLIVLASALNLKRTLYLVDQVRDLNRPMILAVNMMTLAEKRGIFIDAEKLSSELGVPVVLLDAKDKKGFSELHDALISNPSITPREPHYIVDSELPALKEFSSEKKDSQLYHTFLNLVTGTDSELKKEAEAKGIDFKNWYRNEAILRYKFLDQLLNSAVKVDKSKAADFTTKADKILTHKVWGYVIFAAVMFGIFQSVFLIATYPMDWIDLGISSLSEWSSAVLPDGYFSDLISEGLIPGIGGVVIFVPQIAILFFLFSLLEESGYMQRIVFLMDRIMQTFGMSGKSVVPMISGMACAVPAIMSARTIENDKERLITILITPLMTCSARIPVYIVVIALIVPDDLYLGPFHVQGLVLMAMYLLGIFMTTIVGFVLKFVLKSSYKSFLVIDMPEYLKPAMKTVLINVWTNVRSFLWNAGKIIIATSIILFVLATNGGEEFKNATEKVQTEFAELSEEEQEVMIGKYELENSYLGMMGRSIEPVIEPLGYDWKIGIAILTSLAAREVFVGTISTIYSINSEEELTIRDRLKTQKRMDGLPAFGFATCVSLLLFYAFALQCLSTVAVTYKETKSIKWTTIQFVYMTLLAYFTALLAYQLLA